MLKILKFVPVQLTFFLILGILFGYYFSLDSKDIIAIQSVLLVALGISYYFTNKSFNKKFHFNAITYVLCFTVGIATITSKYEVSNEMHYSHFVLDNNSAKLVINEVLKPGNYHHKYMANVINLDGNNTMGKVLLNVQKDSLYLLRVDDHIFIKTTFETVKGPLNPYYFNYKKYLQKKQIHHQAFASSSSILKLDTKKTTIKGLAASFRGKVSNSLINNGFKENELAVINALLLGQRSGISKDLLQNYANAGAIHILAVSGLHVGIILLLLNFIFSPLERLKNGKMIKLIIVVLLLWAFAFVAGLSASVVRAVTMFTAVAIGWQVNRPSNVYNTLVTSIFLLLLIQPYFLFDVGFQLSYLAVFSIVWIQPLIYKIWQPKWKVLDYFWKLLTISFAAQFGILPLSLFYFHQFPGLFFLSNMIIIPMLGLILGIGVLVIVLSLFDFLPAFLGEFYNAAIRFMNSFVEWIGLQEAFLFQNISFSFLMLLASYGIIIFGIRFFEEKNPKRFAVFLVSVLMLQGVFVFEKQEIASVDSFIIFQKSKYSILGKRQGNKMIVYHTLDSVKYSNNKIINQYKLGVGNINIKQKGLFPKVLNFKKKLVFVIDSLGVYQLSNLKPDVVLLQNSPKINLRRMLDSLNPNIVISDGSNYKSYVRNWKLICEQKKTPFYDTSQKGAYILIAGRKPKVNIPRHLR